MVAGAARCYEKILRIDRKSFPANYFLGLTCGQTGQYRKSAELLARAKPTRTNIREALSGNYCRCTGYQAIIDAVESVAQSRAESKK